MKRLSPTPTRLAALGLCATISTVALGAAAAVPAVAASAPSTTSAVAAGGAAATTSRAPLGTSRITGTEGTLSSVSPVTATALAAGHRRFGPVATRRQSLVAYWTPTRMRAAIPAENDRAVRLAIRRFVASGSTSTGVPRVSGVVHPVAPQLVAPATPTLRAPKTLIAGSPATVSLASTGSVSTNPNLASTHPTAFTEGKVFFTKSGVDYVCSGTIVISEGKDSVWTAGHCVHGGSGGTWNSNWTFVPAYDDDLANPRPYGTWSAASLAARTGWVNSSDFSVDFGVATMNPLGGVHIGDKFGGQGFTVNRGKSVVENAFGYPAETPYDGGNLRRCTGTTTPEWDSGTTWSQTVRIPCDMTRGSSGGGWLYGYDGRVGYLNGVNSRIDRIAGPTIMLSPYFDDDAWNLYDDTRYK